jgi:hypothetical protein
MPTTIMVKTDDIVIDRLPWRSVDGARPGMTETVLVHEPRPDDAWCRDPGRHSRHESDAARSTSCNQCPSRLIDGRLADQLARHSRQCGYVPGARQG